MITNENKIHLIGDIDHDMYRKFTKRLSYLEECRFEHGDEIHIVLMSDGGDGQVALAFHDRIKMSPCKISITAIGLVASAAVLILVAGTKEYRTMTPNAWVMVHDDDVGETVNGSRVVHAAQAIKQLERYEDQWNKLMEANTGTSANKWKKLHEAETYLTAEECLQLGIIDDILYPESKKEEE